MEDSYIKFSGLKWLFEMELVQEPQVINAIKMNILMLSKHIKEVEILTVEQNKQMLILLKLNWIGRTFLRERLCDAAHEVILQMLPNFRIRVTADSDLFEKSLDKLRKAVQGVKDSSPNTNDN